MLYEPRVEMKRDAGNGYKFLDSDRTMNVLDWVIFLRERAYEDAITIYIVDSFGDSACVSKTINPEDPIPNEFKPYFHRKVSNITWCFSLALNGNHWFFDFNLSLSR